MPEESWSALDSFWLRTAQGHRIPRSSVSAHQLAAVDLDDLAYKVVSPRRGQEHHSPGDFFGGSLAADRDGTDQLLAYVGGREAVVEGGGDDARGHPVDQDALSDELLRHGAGEGADAPLGRRVGYRARRAAGARGD